jgi:hypothetical protein
MTMRWAMPDIAIFEDAVIETQDINKDIAKTF